MSGEPERPSVGLVATVELLATSLPVLALCRAGWYLVTTDTSAVGDGWTKAAARDLTTWLPTAARRHVPVAVVVVMVVLNVVLWAKADHYADAVRAGHPVRLGSAVVTSFGIRATPVELVVAPGVDSTGELDEIVARAKTSPGLLYLGQADGQIVMYDAVTQRALYLSRDLVVLQLVNCDNPKIRDDRCLDAVG